MFVRFLLPIVQLILSLVCSIQPYKLYSLLFLKNNTHTWCVFIYIFFCMLRAHTKIASSNGSLTWTSMTSTTVDERILLRSLLCSSPSLIIVTLPHLLPASSQVSYSALMRASVTLAAAAIPYVLFCCCCLRCYSRPCSQIQCSHSNSLEKDSNFLRESEKVS